LFLQLIDELPNVDFVTPFFHWEMIEADKDDNKYVDCMVAGQADFLVTADKHFNILNQIEFPELKVIDLESFSKLLRRE
jgi:predicted nucleic acid-binding protein